MTQKPSRQKVLIVDDSPDNIAMLRNALHPDYKIYFALSGQEALDFAASDNRPDLILLDILMPEMDGFEVCKQLKLLKNLQDIPVIFITAKSEPAIETKGLELGAVDFITKPFNPPVVKARVQTHLKLINTFEQLKDRESHLRSILDSALDAIITTDQKGRVVDFNPFAETLFGYSKRHALSHNIVDLIVPPEFRAQHSVGIKRYVDLAQTDQARPLKRRFEVSGLRVDGTRIDLEVALVATYRQNELFFTAFLHDITERNHLLNSLNETLHAAEEANRAKSDFLANMSHEIRTPMNAITGLTKLALKADLSPKVTDYLIKVDHAAHSMLGVINDILEFSRIEAGHMQLNPVDFDLHDVFGHLGDLFRRQQSEGKDVELILSISSTITQLHGDSMRLEQVLSNLIGNALKFTKCGEIVVDAVLLEQNAKWVHIEFSVQDTGIGIDPSRLPDLFESFVQADSSITRKYGGTGLGLAICKRIVKIMGGKIWAESTPGKGSVFRFTANFESRSETVLTSWEFPKTLGIIKVLIVDNNPKSRQLLEGMLHTFSCETTVVDSVLEAVSLLKSAMEKSLPYGLVFLNLRKSEREDLKVYEQGINELSSLVSSTVTIAKAVLLTNNTKEEAFAQKFGFVVDHWIEKPIHRSLVFNAILDVFGEESAKRSVNIGQDGVEEIQVKQSIGGARILVVEDNAINMQVIRELLNRVGLVVEEANHGKMALRMVQTRIYDAVIMDLQMPEMDGFTATRLIRGDKRFIKLPIIAMTAHAMEEDRQKCLEAGMNGHVSKPFDPKELYDQLTRWIDITPPTVDVPIESIQSTVELPDLPGLNTEEGIARMGGDVDLYKRMLLRFYEDHAQDAEKIITLLSTSHREEGGRLVHTTKSIAGQLGAHRLFQASVVLEKGIDQRDPNERLFLEEFRLSLNEVIAILAPLSMDVSSNNESLVKHKTINLETVATHLKNLAVLLEEQDSKADVLLIPLQEELQGHSTEKTLKEIEKMLKRYDYVGSLDALSEIAGELGVMLSLRLEN